MNLEHPFENHSFLIIFTNLHKRNKPNKKVIKQQFLGYTQKLEFKLTVFLKRIVSSIVYKHFKEDN